MKRACIVLDKNLSSGQSSNVSAILLGELGTRTQGMFADEPLVDKTGVPHAAIRCSTIVLAANSAVQLGNFVANLSGAEGIVYCVFSQYGQNLHDEPQQYEAHIKQSQVADHSLVGVAIWGEYDEVKKLTKKFRLLE